MTFTWTGKLGRYLDISLGRNNLSLNLFHFRASPCTLMSRGTCPSTGTGRGRTKGGLGGDLVGNPDTVRRPRQWTGPELNNPWTSGVGAKVCQPSRQWPGLHHVAGTRLIVTEGWIHHGSIYRLFGNESHGGWYCLGDAKFMVCQGLIELGTKLLNLGLLQLIAADEGGALIRTERKCVRISNNNDFNE